MTDINKAEASHAEANPLGGTAPTQSEVATCCPVEIRQHNKSEIDLGGIVHGADLEAAASGRVRQIEQIEDEIRRVVRL
jgi:hypothetical protein